jgi:D-glycero-D-manno-heptose 1,7-bisphosphate phosphatase
MTNAALFLDRDGVINVDHDYVYRIENVEFIPGIFDLVHTARDAAYKIIIVTNQSGIGRGYYTEAQFHVLMQWMRQRFEERGGRIDGIYFCPFHPDHGVGDYKQESNFRKPGPGMLLQAQKDHDLDLARSIFIGDKPSDMEAGKRAGVGTLIYLGNAINMAGVFPVSRLEDALPYLLPVAKT